MKIREEILNFNRKGEVDNAHGGDGPNAKKLFSGFFWIGFGLLGVFILVTAIYWSQTDAGERTLISSKEWIKENNPVTWYLDLLGGQKTIDYWGTETNASSTKKGINLIGLESISEDRVPAGQDIQLKYNIDYYEIDRDGIEGVEFFCDLKDSKEINNVQQKITEGEIIPAKNNLRKGDSVRCKIDGDNTLGLDGQYIVDGGFSFPFETKDVELKVYFIEGKLADQLLQEDEEFFEKYKIDESLPIQAVYNGEPIEVAIGVGGEGTEEQPVIVRSEEYDSYPIIGIGLKNKWDGKVKEITDMTLFLPDGVEINEELSQNPSISCPFYKAVKGVYKLDLITRDELFKQKIFEGMNLIEDSRNFECWLKVDESFIGNSLYAIDYYAVDLEYIYELNKQTTVITIKAPGAELE